MPKKTKLDGYDYAILEILKTDASITNKGLSNQIGLSPPATLERVRNLKKTGFLLDSGYNLNWKKLGFDYEVFLMIQVPVKGVPVLLSCITRCTNILTVYELSQSTVLETVHIEQSFAAIGVFRSYREFVKVWSSFVEKTPCHIRFSTYELKSVFRTVQIQL